MMDEDEYNEYLAAQEEIAAICDFQNFESAYAPYAPEGYNERLKVLSEIVEKFETEWDAKFGEQAKRKDEERDRRDQADLELAVARGEPLF